MLKLLSPELRPAGSFPALGCASGGGRLVHVEVPWLWGEVDLPAGTGLEALLLFSDLQCHDHGTPARLLSHAVFERVIELGGRGLLPAPSSIGVVVAGDLWAYPPSEKRRGGAGDVQDIWEMGAGAFRWIAGVAGNHDLFFGEPRFPAGFESRSNLFALDGQCITQDGLRIAGISGIEGKAAKPWRYDFWDMRRTLARLLAKDEPDLLVLHQGPRGLTPEAVGDPAINLMIEAASRKTPLVAFGHRRWPMPLEHVGETAYVSLDSRVVLLTRPGWPVPAELLPT